MGRENISLGITVRKKDLDVFIDRWNQFLQTNNQDLDEDYLLTTSSFEDDTVDPDSVMYSEDEIANLFDMPTETGMLDFCRKMLHDYPDIEFDIDYYLSWDNCGETAIEEYHVGNGRISYDIMSGDYFCSEDDFDDMQEDLAELLEDDPDAQVEKIDCTYYVIANHEQGIEKL